MKQYYILHSDSTLTPLFEFLEQHGLQFEIHANRTRFWVPDGSLHTEFLLRFGHCCPSVDPSLDLATGLPVDSR